MNNGNDIDMSPGLQQFILLAIGLGVDNLQKLGSLIPMILSSRNDELDLAGLAVEGDDVISIAAAAIDGLDPTTDFYALLFDGKLNIEGMTLNAIIVQAGERGGGQAHMVYQEYEAKTYKLVGAPEYAGRVAHLNSRGHG